MVKSKELELKKKTQHEHILDLPDTYIGSISKETRKMWIYEGDQIIQKEIEFVPGLFKIFDEIVVNARDQIVEDKLCNEIDVKINKDKAKITVYNNGRGIPVKKDANEDVYVPEMAFSHLLTSTNYDRKGKTTGGKNGFGAKLTNIYSKSFIIETVDNTRKLKFKQKFSNNMFDKEEAEVEKTDSKGYVEITFVPDLKKFGLKELSDDMYALFKKRVYDIAMCCGTKVKVSFDGKVIKNNNFKTYIDLYFPENSEFKPILELGQDRWNVGVVYDPSRTYTGQVSFVNSICTYAGGTHIDYITDQIINELKKKMKTKKINIKPANIKECLFIFVDATIEDPSFNSQTKEDLKTKVAEFGSKFTISEAFIKKLAKTDILKYLEDIIKLTEARSNTKTDGKKTAKISGIGKLHDAQMAGTKESSKCRLLLTEGDSALTFALSGFSVVGNKYFGAFPLKGKLLNVREKSITQITENEEIINIKKILGLKNGRIVRVLKDGTEQILSKGEDYSDISKLRYGGIVILSDQDVDGHHIKGLIINMLYYFWPTLKVHKDFIQVFKTPIVKCKKKNEVIEFNYNSEFQDWLKEHGAEKGWDIKYYKGLGTSTPLEAKECFSNYKNNVSSYFWEDTKYNKKELEQDETNSETIVPKSKYICDDTLDLAFNKNRPDDRKIWLKSYDPNIILDGNEDVSINDFINKELIHFSSYDNVRSIPNIVDGFKPSQRKVMYTIIKKKITKETKVASLTGAVMNTSHYHHGEASLQGTIVNMAQNFVGSNNINELDPCGQFGSRLKGGEDSASARYIFTRMTSIIPFIFNKLDDRILKHVLEDGSVAEPKYFYPTIPMILVNGTSGIGTGYSSDVPCFNPRDIVNNIKRHIAGEEQEKMIPWYRYFKGTIEIDDTVDKKTGKKKKNSYITKGIYEVIDDDTIEIKELPIGMWTQNYKDFLEDLLNPEVKEAKKNVKAKKQGKTVKTKPVKKSKKDDDEDDDKKKKKKPDTLIVDYKEKNTDTIANFIVTFAPKKLKALIKSGELEKVMKLTTSLSTSNMHLFDKDCKIRKYKNTQEIIKDFAEIKLQSLQERKDKILEDYKHEMNIYYWKMKFIEAVIDKEIKINKRKKDDIINDLVEMKFPKIYIKKVSKTTEDDETNENEEEKDDEKANYSYLTSIPIFAFTLEEIEKLRKKIKDLEELIEELEKSTPSKLWKKDIKDFMEFYNKWETEEEKKFWEIPKNKKKTVKKE